MLELDPYRQLPDPGETGILEIRPEVAVIGAGISGLIAARILAEHGYPVTIFDKGRNPGGRTSTRQEGEYSFDHGCQYFTAHDRRFLRYVEAWVEQGIVSTWEARRASCLPGVVSPVHDDVVRYVGVPGMNAVARHLAKNLDLRPAVTVKSLVKADQDSWRLEASELIEGNYEVVLCSAPPSQSAAILANVAPDLSSRVKDIPMQPCWTAMATFDYDLETVFDAAHFSASPLVWAANNGSKPGRLPHECWVLQASPSWTRDHLDMPPDEVAQRLLAAFFGSTGIASVTPRYLGAHRWRYASPAAPLGSGCLWDAEAGIGLCGDWCHSARLEGAFLSGLLLAERVLDDRPRAKNS